MFSFDDTTRTVTIRGEKTIKPNELFKNAKHIIISGSTKKIERDAFRDCSRLESISMPDCINQIGDCAFYDCKKLKSVILPEKLKEIPQNLFSGCSKLEYVKISRSIENINPFAFNGCLNLKYFDVDEASEFYCSIDSVLFEKSKSVLIRYPPNREGDTYTVPATVTSINDMAFSECVNLKSLILSEKTECAGIGSFDDCKRLKEIYLPHYFVSLWSGSFNGCHHLKAFKVDEQNKFFYAEEGVLFAYDTLIKYPAKKTAEHYTIPPYIDTIGECAFEGCSNLVSVELSRVSVIKNWAFKDCENLKTLTLPDTLTKIEYGAFEGCTALESVTIPESIQTIGLSAFDECTALKTINIRPKKLTKWEAFDYGSDEIIFHIYGNADQAKRHLPKNAKIVLHQNE